MLKHLSKVFIFTIIILALFILPAASALYTAKAVALPTPPINFAGTTSFATASGTEPSAIVTHNMLCSQGSCGPAQQDIVTADGSSGTVSVYINNGNHTFTGHSYKTCYPTQPCATSGSQNGANVVDVTVGDFNGDGLPDVAAAVLVPGSSEEVVVWLNQGAAVLGKPTVTLMPWGARSVVSADLGGAHTDLIVGSSGQWAAVGAPFTGDAIQVLHGNGDGTFQSLATSDIYEYGTFRDWYGGSYSQLKLADLGNGHLDIVALDNQCNGNDWGHYDVYMGDGSGHFAITSSEVPTTCTIGNFSLADFNGDGKLDIVGIQQNGPFTNQHLDVHPGNGDGTFGLYPVTFPTNPARAVVSGDFNGDNKADALFIAGNGIDAYTGNSDGTLTAAGTTPTPPNPTTIASGNLSTTGTSQDVIIGSRGDGSLTPPIVPQLTILWNKQNLPVPGAPNSVTNTDLGLGKVSVSWGPSRPYNVMIDHYDVYEVHADKNNTVGNKVATVSGTASVFQTTVSNLNLCTYYRYGVVAVASNGNQSAITLPNRPAYTSGSTVAGTIPKTVVIMALGVSSHLSGGGFQPLNNQSYCTSEDGITSRTNAPEPLQGLMDFWDNRNPKTDKIDHDPNYFGAGNRMIDSFASKGAVILPFSYNRSFLIGTVQSTNPTFTSFAYDASNVGDLAPEEVANRLDGEIKSIHHVWPNTHIILVGHSAGGLAVELWWEQHGQYNPQGVKHAFSLDSPINGAKKNLCSVPVITIGCGALGFGGGLTSKVAQLWKAQPGHTDKINKIYKRSPIFTAVGTVGDFLWDATDGRVMAQVGLNQLQIDDGIGLVSQVFTSNGCVKAAYAINADPGCTVTGPSFLSTCGTKVNRLPDGGYFNGYGIPWSLFTHSVVKNCPGVTAQIMTYFP